MEQTVKLTSDNQKAALNLTSPQTLSSSTNRFSRTFSRKRQNIYKIKKKKKSDLTLFVAYVMTTWSCVWICTLLALVANLLNLGTVGWRLASFQEQTVYRGSLYKTLLFYLRLSIPDYTERTNRFLDSYFFIYLLTCAPFLLFPPWCSHIYSWRIFKPFSGLLTKRVPRIDQ